VTARGPRVAGGSSDESSDPNDQPDRRVKNSHGNRREDGRTGPLDDVMEDIRRELVVGHQN
jgi:hypothetical protein